MLVMIGCVEKLPESGVPRWRPARAGVLGDIGLRLSDPFLLMAAGIRVRMGPLCMLGGNPIRCGAA